MDLGLGGILALVSIGVLALPLIVAAVLVILVVANRADPDPSGRRPAVVYLYAVAFVTVFVTLFATFEIVAQLTSLIGSHPAQGISSQDFGSESLGAQLPTIVAGGVGPKHPVGDAVARGAVLGVLLTLVAGGMYLLHVRAAQRATRDVAPVEPAGRVRSSYVSAVSFVCVVIIVASLVAATYQIFRIIAPGVFNAGGAGDRLVALRTFLPLIYLAAGGTAILVAHIRQFPPQARPWLGGSRPTPPSDAAVAVAPPPPAPAPPQHQSELLESGPPPRKRAVPSKSAARRTTSTSRSRTTTTRRPPAEE